LKLSLFIKCLLSSISFICFISNGFLFVSQFLPES
jgi:hypothetical protein